MFVGDSTDTFAVKFPPVSMGGRAEGLACADPGARTPIGARGISLCTHQREVETVVEECWREEWRSQSTIPTHDFYQNDSYKITQDKHWPGLNFPTIQTGITEYISKKSEIFIFSLPLSTQ